MRTLIFHGRSNSVLLEAGVELRDGEHFEATDERAEELLTDPNVHVTDATEEPDEDLDGEPDEDLDEHLEQPDVDSLDLQA